MSLLEFLLIDFISRINSNQHENDSNERVDNSSYEEIKTKVDISLKTENNDLEYEASQIQDHCHDKKVNEGDTTSRYNHKKRQLKSPTKSKTSATISIHEKGIRNRPGTAIPKLNCLENFNEIRHMKILHRSQTMLSSPFSSSKTMFRTHCQNVNQQQLNHHHHHHHHSYLSNINQHPIEFCKPKSKSKSKSKSMLSLPNTFKIKSSESWIPADIRSRMIQRDLSVAQQNFDDLKAYQTSTLREYKRYYKLNFDVDELAKSKALEKYGIETRKNCGLCRLSFLSVNLVMAIPLKAVLDIRDSWRRCNFDNEGLDEIRVNPNWKKAPACYNEIRVCVFCAQLFDQQQDKYRPSWEAREEEKTRLKRLEEQKIRKVKSDPLAELEKERIETVHHLIKKNELDSAAS